MKTLIIALTLLVAFVSSSQAEPWVWKDTQSKYTTICIPQNAPSNVKKAVFRLIAEIRFDDGETATTKQVIVAESRSDVRKISDPTFMYHMWSRNTVHQPNLSDVNIQKIRIVLQEHGGLIIRSEKNERRKKLKDNDIEMVPTTGP